VKSTIPKETRVQPTVHTMQTRRC